MEQILVLCARGHTWASSWRRRGLALAKMVRLVRAAFRHGRSRGKGGRSRGGPVGFSSGAVGLAVEVSYAGGGSAVPLEGGLVAAIMVVRRGEPAFNVRILEISLAWVA